MNPRTDLAMRSIGAACLATALAVGGCGGGSSTPPTSSVPSTSAVPGVQVAAVEPAGAPKPAALPKEPPAGPALAPLNYESKGRRDPFVAITSDKGDKDRLGLSVRSLKLAGVIRGRTLLALVEAPDGLGYILKSGDRLGDGHVTDITQNSVTFAVSAKPGQAPTTATIRLGQD